MDIQLVGTLQGTFLQPVDAYAQEYGQATCHDIKYLHMQEECVESHQKRHYESLPPDTQCIHLCLVHG